MKRSWLLLTFALATLGFDAYGMINDQTVCSNDASDNIEFYWSLYGQEFGVLEHLFRKGNECSYRARVFLNGKNRYVTLRGTFLEGHALRVLRKDILYCNEKASQTYGKVFDSKGALLDPDLSNPCPMDGFGSTPQHSNGSDTGKEHLRLDEGVAQKKEEDESPSYSTRAFEALKSKPVIIVGVSAATAGATYAIVKFINMQWKREYNAKKVAVYAGIGAGVITGACLYWPVSEIETVE